MEKEFIPYGLAVKLKELGFDEPCFGSYYNYSEENFKEGELGYDYRGELNIEYSVYYYENKYYILAPTWQQAFRWFRDRYGLWFRPDYYGELSEYNFQGNIHKLGKHNSIADISNYKTAEEVELDCLKKLIEIVENEKTL